MPFNYLPYLFDVVAQGTTDRKFLLMMQALRLRLLRMRVSPRN